MRSPFKSENPFPFSSAFLDDEQKRLGDVLCAFQRGDTKRREKKSLVSFCLGFYFLNFFFLCEEKMYTRVYCMRAKKHTNTHTNTNSFEKLTPTLFERFIIIISISRVHASISTPSGQ